MAVRIFLVLSALVWAPYGFFLLLHPSSLAGIAGVVAGNTTGTTELRAMYGGLELGLGLLCTAAAVRPRLVRTALTALAFLCAGLAIGRLIGVVTDGGFSGYTFGALVFEIGSATLAGNFLRRIGKKGDR